MGIKPKANGTCSIEKTRTPSRLSSARFIGLAVSGVTSSLGYGVDDLV
jgi:hypothetical protein